MCTGLALPLSELPATLLDTPAIEQRRYVREGREEVQFHWWQVPTILPVQWEGQLRLLPWGTRDRRGTLPVGGWIHISSIHEWSSPERVVIPAVLGFHAGTWFLISTGVAGVVLQSRDGPVVYMLTRPATNYYRNMTEQQGWMPALVDQVI